MKVLVVNSALPFVRGGAEELADKLVENLNQVPGVESELLRIPFKWTPSERLIDEIVLTQSLRIVNADKIIALKFPAYLVPHEHKTLWLLHQFRQAYDLGDVGQGLGDAGRDAELKQVIRTADDRCFASCRNIYVNSPVTQARLKLYNTVESRVLYPPVNDEELFCGGEQQGYIFAGGRVGPGKRQHLLVDAYARTERSAPLLIAGPPDSQEYADLLHSMVDQYGLSSCVHLKFGFHPRQQVASWVNGALACAYLPYNEDSLGYVCMEAFAAGKPVLTASDAGGLLEIVSRDTGWVVPPEPEAIAVALSDIAADATTAVRLGGAAQELWRKRAITWSETISILLS